MNRIIFPLKPEVNGSAVADLQDGLRLLVEKKRLTINEADWQAMDERLHAERTHDPATYGRATRALVGLFQQQRGIEATGAVEESGKTAEILNHDLEEIGAFEPPPPPERRSVEGLVKRDDNQPAADMTVAAFHDGDGSSVELGHVQTGADGRYKIEYDPPAGVASINLRVVVLGPDGKPLRESAVVPEAQPHAQIDVAFPALGIPVAQARIEGRVLFQNELPAENLKLRLYRRDFGGDAGIVADCVTTSGGKYALTYDAAERAASFEIRAVDGANVEVLLTESLNDLGAGPVTTINLVAPNSLQPVAAEYKRLVDDLTPHVVDMAKLATAVENDTRQDLTVLNRATGWDARVIALAATAQKLGAEPDVGLSAEGVYGLLRAGLPSDKETLAQVGPDVAEQALKTGVKAGVVNLSDQEISAFKEQFTNFSVASRLATAAPGSQSTYSQMLQNSGLNAEAQGKFAAVFLEHGADSATMWDKAREAGLGEPQIGRLQMQGKLSFLTGNSHVMASRLGAAIDPGRPDQLVDKDFHLQNTWITEIHTAAGIPEDRANNLTDADKANLDALIPTAYEAETVEARRDLWADDMARKVRISYPTQVVGRMIETDDADPFKVGTARTATAKLLKNAAQQGFRLGQTPVELFLRTYEGARGDLSDEEFAVAKEEMRGLQRAYQMTPTNEAMAVVRDIGLHSAYDVVGISEDLFMDYHGHKFPSKKEAALVYRKAQQVASATYNLFAAAKSLDTDVPVFGWSAPPEVRKAVKSELIKQFPTMQDLFGSSDLCDCEHCHSVLSPAAYLVDLLQFVDPETTVWDGFTKDWESKHPSAYPYEKPYKVLIDRRPDLANIPLTCENTLTELPYIDLVNEILEYYVANGHLAADAARDTGEASSEELLTEPRNVIPEAYQILAGARYPMTLPFDLWLETVRQFSDYVEAPLTSVLEMLRESDVLLESKQRYDRSSIFYESLGLSPAEIDIFTDVDALTDRKWYELYGYSAARPAITAAALNGSEFTVSISDDAAGGFRAGQLCAYLDSGTNTLSQELHGITSVGAPGSAGVKQTKITFAEAWTTPPKAGDLLAPDAPAALRSARTLANTLGVTYKQLVEIVESAWANPKLQKLSVLEKMGIGIHSVVLCRDPQNRAFYTQNSDLLGKSLADLPDADKVRFNAMTSSDWNRLAEIQAYDVRLDDFAKETKFTAAQLEAELASIPLDSILVLADQDAGCDFDQTTLRYASARAADEIAFLKINLFVRLWRKLGWTIEETGRALQTFVPASAEFTGANLAQKPLATALWYLAHLKSVEGKVRVGKQARSKLLTLWSDLPTTGKGSLYAQLFLSRGVLNRDDVFDHPFGQYLSAGWITATAQNRDFVAEKAGVAPGAALNPAAFADQKLMLTYSPLEQVQYLSYRGVITDPEKAALTAVAGASPFLSDLLDAVQASGEAFSLIKGHAVALQGALGLTADDIALILIDAGESIDTAVLSLPNVSVLYRYALLAKGIKLSVPQLISLKQMSGLNPFKPLPANSLVNLTDDHLFTQTIRFIEMADEVKSSGLKIEDIEYLLRHKYDENGPYKPNLPVTLALLRSLVEGIRGIRLENAVPDDPATLSDEVIQQKLALVFAPDIVARFLAMMNNTVEFTASFSTDGLPAADHLDQERFRGEPTIVQVWHDDILREQKLTFRGVLTDAKKATLFATFPTTNTGVAHQDSAVFGGLLADVQTQQKAFFEKYFLKPANNLQPQTGFLKATDFDLLFGPGNPAMTKAERDRQQRTALAQAFLPFLRDRLIRQLVAETLTGQTGGDPSWVEALLTDSTLLSLDPTGAATTTLLDALTAASEPGASIKFYSTVDGTGAPSPTLVSIDADTGLKDANGQPIRPAGSESALIEAYVEVPAAGDYRFYVLMDKEGASAELKFDHLPAPTILRTAATAAAHEVGTGADQYVELKAGSLYRFTLDLHDLNGGEARVFVQGETLPKGPLSVLNLYPAETIDSAERALLLLNKVLKLTVSLDLMESEVLYMLANEAKYGGLDFKLLPTSLLDESKHAGDGARITALFGQFLRMNDFSRLKRDLAGGTEGLVGIFEAPATGTDNAFARIASITRREEATVEATARALFGQNVTIDTDVPLRRVWEALQVVQRFGVPVSSLVQWTRIVKPAASPAEVDQRFRIARDLKEALKAQVDPDNWQRASQPIFDRLRQRQRDALVAHVMHREGFVRSEQLYEYFLIDPGMEPVVRTSRIRAAIGTVQLFVQRCLLNLELRVHPAAIINAKQWEWMKRYRVWEANRKIFLFPENWLEPEFRDDKTHLYSELEGTLLKDDVSSDMVEDAFLNYLRKLDELARLDIVAMHLEYNTDPANNVLHVIGRTFSQPHKHFYRRYVHQTWTPWEPVGADLEGDHIVPVIWRDRLYVFWLTFLEKGNPAGGSAKDVDPRSSIHLPTLARYIEVQLHWCEYMKGEWTTPESSGYSAADADKVISTGTLADDFHVSQIVVHVSKNYDPDSNELGVYVHMGSPITRSFYLAGRNSAPVPRGYTDNSEAGAVPHNPYLINPGPATRYHGSSALKVEYGHRISTDQKPTNKNEDAGIFTAPGNFLVLECNNNVATPGTPDIDAKADTAAADTAAIESGLAELGWLSKPVFYQDERNTFFIEPTVQERTIEDWQDWVTPAPDPPIDWSDPIFWQALKLIPQVNKKLLALPPGDGDFRVDSRSLNKFEDMLDPLINPVTVVAYGGELIGPQGHAGMAIAAASAGAMPFASSGGVQVKVTSASGLESGSVVVSTNGDSLERAGLHESAAGINIVGGMGMSPSAMGHVEAFRNAELSNFANGGH